MLWCIHLDGFGSSYRMFRKKNQNFHLVFFIICLFFFLSKGKYDIDIYFLFDLGPIDMPISQISHLISIKFKQNI